MADHDTVLGDDLLGDDALRLLDVLLEEEVAAATHTNAATSPLVIAPVRSANWQWLAAALLGIAVVVATSWLTTHAPTPAPTTPIQDPVPRAVEVVPYDAALLGQVVVVRTSLAQNFGFVEADANIHVETRDAAQLAAWREALTATSDRWSNPGAQFTIELGLADGKVMRGRGWFGSLTFGGTTIATTSALQEFLQGTNEALLRAHRRARGIAADLDELRELDPTSRAIVSPWLTGNEAKTELRRFPLLESIEFAPGACLTRQADAVKFRSGKDLASGLAEIPTLQHVVLLGAYLDAGALRALATLPKLRSLVIPSGLAEVPAEELGALARRLEVLHVQGSLLSDEQLLAIRRSTTLKELWVRCGMTSQSLVDGLVALPSLRRLSVVGYGHDCSPLLAAIARTRVAELRLEEMSLTNDAVAALAALPSLHTLHLVDISSAAFGTLDLEPLQQLRHLAFDWTWASTPWSERTRAALPNCAVHDGTDVDDPWVSPFSLPRR